MKPKESIFIRGIGWVDSGSWGRVLCGHDESCAGDLATLWKSTDVFTAPVKNAGRFDHDTRLTMTAVALALGDGARCGAGAPGRGTGLLGVNQDGCVSSCKAFFEDYLKAGRLLARGNLFIYTLPSSPLAEAAIHFGFEGTMFYAGVVGSEARCLLATARTMIMDGLSDVLAVRVRETECIAFWIGRGDAASGPVLPVDNDVVRDGSDEPVAVLAGRLRQLMKGNGTLCE